MAENGSPTPLFETDELTYVLVTLPIHHLSGTGTRVSDQASDQVKNLIFNNLSEIFSFCDQASIIIKNEIHERVVEMLVTLNDWQSKANLLEKLNLSKHTTNRKKYLDPLIEYGWVSMEFPENKTTPNQRYRITDSGERLLKLIKVI